MEVVRRALPPTTDQYDAFCTWVEEVCGSVTRLLDIGAGDGDDDYACRLRPSVSCFVGVDPDPGIARNPCLDERHQLSLEQYAASGPAQFDVAVAVYVVEHVSEPATFLRAVRRCLKPGGSFFALTPNLWHYFGLLARLSGALRLDDELLRLVRVGKPDIHHVAHFPVRYRLNSVRAIGRHGEAAGFRRLELRHLDNPEVFQTYFPGRLGTLPRLYSNAAYRRHLDALLGTLLVKLTA